MIFDATGELRKTKETLYIVLVYIANTYIYIY